MESLVDFGGSLELVDEDVSSNKFVSRLPFGIRFCGIQLHCKSVKVNPCDNCPDKQKFQA